MALPKRTSENQLNLPIAVVDQVGRSESYDVVSENGCIVLTPVHPGAATAVCARLAEMGLSDADGADAVRWARQA